MKVLVCLKQVPNTKEIKIDSENHTLIRKGVDSILNPHDDYALEQALFLKKKYGVKVGAITMGPPQAIEILKYSIQRGADEAFLLTDERLVGSDTWATALAIVAVIKKVNYKNIFCGQESIDSGTGHIGASIAELLSMCQITYAKKVIRVNNNKIRILSKFDNGDAIIEADLPIVVSFLKSDEKIKFESLEIDVDQIKQYSIDEIGLNEKDVGLNGSFTQVVKIDIDERFVGYMTVDNSLKADDRVKVILDGGITEKRNRKIIKSLTKEEITNLANLIK